MDVDTLCRAIRAYESYAEDVDSNFWQPRERLFKSLPAHQQAFLQSLQARKRSRFRAALAHNDRLAKAIAAYARTRLTAGEDELREQIQYRIKSKATKPTSEDHAIVRAAIRQIWRDWTVEAHEEREACHNPVIGEINRWFPHGHRARIMIPGCGLSRLARDLAIQGHDVEASDVSYITILASSFMISRNTTQQFVVCPWLTQFSNHETSDRQFAEYILPEIQTQPESDDLLFLRLEAATSMSLSAPLSFGNTFTLNDKDFTRDFRSPVHQGRFDVIATCFFVDTAKNLLSYISTIRHLLAPGGTWINIGPLLWNCYENGPGGRREGDIDSDEDQRVRVGRSSPWSKGVGQEWDEKLEFSLEECLMVIQGMGMHVSTSRMESEAGYVCDGESMLQAKYRLAFWVARN